LPAPRRTSISSTRSPGRPPTLNHRGATHSLLLLPRGPGFVAWLLAQAAARTARLARALWHLGHESRTAHRRRPDYGYGTQILWPLSDWRPALGATFVIDLWFSGIILAGLAVSAFFYRSRIPGIVAGAVLAGYVGFQSVEKQKALELAGNTPPAAASRRRR